MKINHKDAKARRTDESIIVFFESSRFDFFVFLALALAPAALLAPQLVSGAIPWFMDPIMYFFPLRWHAAQLLVQGELPLWNRCLLGGMPLFANPQAALAYPFNWPMLLWPSAFHYIFPLALQLGLFAALTFALLRRLGLPRAAALWGGALCLAGNYGWSRLQFGNYLNVLPWWPLWLTAAHGFAADGRGRRIALGAVAAAMTALAGAHQLAVYGAGALALYAWLMAGLDAPSRRRWLGYLFSTGAVGALLAAPGWLPQLAFMRETARDLDPARVLAGTFGSWREIAAALVGPLDFSPADAGASASVGVSALILAGLVPSRRRCLLPWAGCWLMALATILPAWRPVAKALIDLTPLAATFHDPRRMLGVAQWALILASAFSLAGWLRPGAISLARFLALHLPALAIAAMMAALHPWPGFWPPLALFALTAAMLAIGIVTFRNRVPRAEENAASPATPPSREKDSLLVKLAVALAFVSVGALGLFTWKTTDFSFVPARALFGSPEEPPLLFEAKPEPPQRFFTLDWQRAYSYDFRRPDLRDWMLPNLGMLWGLEDIGGYEPARTPRYDRWYARASAWSLEPTPRRQPWRGHFRLLYPPAPDSEKYRYLAQANLGAAVMPRWGATVPFVAQEQAPGFFPWDPRHSVLRVVLADTQPEMPAPEISATATFYSISGNSFRQIFSHSFRRTPKPEPAGDLLGGNAESGDGLAVPLLVRRLSLGRRPGASFDAMEGRGRGRYALLGAFVWNDALQQRFRPVAAGDLAMVFDYAGRAEWVEFIAEAGDESGRGRLLDKKIQTNRVMLEVEWTGGKPATLELHDAFWSGWRATVNGEPAEIRADMEGRGLWRRVKIPPGPSRVVFAYRPPGLTASLVLALIGAALACILGGRVGPGRHDEPRAPERDPRNVET